MRQRLDAGTLWHLAGATITKIAPVGVQFVLLLIVARNGSLEDVGRLALASAGSFLCGALGEFGFGTTLSVPHPYFGTSDPPLRATRRLRFGTAFAGTVVYVLLWACGLGQHDPRFLLVAPLPIALALAAGYAGVMNAAGRLRIEGFIAVGESVVILLLVPALAAFMPTLSAVLLALTLGRIGGTLYRAWVVHRFPHSDDPVADVARVQSPFAIGTGVIVIQGQADLLIIGFMGSLAIAGVYGPLLRVAYGTLLIAEALSWAMYGRVGAAVAASSSEQDAMRVWRTAALWVGIPLALVFMVGVDPLLHFLLDQPVTGLTGAILIFGGLIVVRFMSTSVLLHLMRGGQQRRQVPVLALAAVVLTAGAIVAAAADSITGLAAARLASELVLLAGYVLAARRMTGSVPA